MGLSNNSKDINDILQILENIKARDNLIVNNNEALKVIGVFVLLIGKLETAIKTIIFQYGRKKSLETKTLGVLIKEIEAILKRSKYNDNIKGNRDYRLKSFLKEQNVNIFIKNCEEINKLRNDLIHNFISSDKDKTKVKSIQEILTKVKKVIQLSASPTSKHEMASKTILQSKKIIDDFILENSNILCANGKIRAKLTIDGLIEICSFYNKCLKSC
jgi:hypothetical protein